MADFPPVFTKVTTLDFLFASTHTSLPTSVAQLGERPIGDQEVADLTPAEASNILSWRLIMKYFLWSFSPFL